MRKFLLVTSAAAGLMVVGTAAQAQLYVNGDQPVFVAANSASAGFPAGPEVDAMSTTTADPRVTESMVEPYLPRVGGQQQWPVEDVVGDTAPHPLFIDIAERQPEPVPQVAAAQPAAPDPESLRDTLYFEFDHADLTPEAQAKVRELASVMRNWDLRDVEVTGHADRSGTAAYNEDLSRRRAETVAGALRSQGLNPTVMETEWYGESRPAVPTPDGQRLQENRRVVIQAVE